MNTKHYQNPSHHLAWVSDRTDFWAWRFRTLLAPLVILLGLAVTAGAESPKSQDSTSTAQTASANTPSQRFILLVNDQVLDGKVQETNDGWRLTTASGVTCILRRQQIQTLADSLLGLYEYKSSRIPANDLSERFKLVKWCAAQGLNTQVELELEQILKFDPLHTQAVQYKAQRENLRHVAELPTPTNPTTTVSTAVSNPSEAIDSFIRGYGAENLQFYTKNLERHLFNHCGRCHISGRHQGEFRLYRPSSGKTDQRYTARNLETMLALIDLDEPNRSPILYFSVQAPHGPLSSPPFGSINDPGYRLLRQWVMALSNKHRFVQGLPPGVPGSSDNASENVNLTVDRPLPPRRLEGNPSITRPLADLPNPPSGRIVADDAMPPAPTQQPYPKPSASPPDPVSTDRPNPAPMPTGDTPPAEEADPFDPSRFNDP